MHQLPLMSAYRHITALFGLVIAIMCHVWIDEARAESSGSGTAARSVRIDSKQSEFERLMAVARQTRQGTGARVSHLSIENRPAIGDENAPLVLVEIASFECPYCRRHWLDTMPELRQRYIDSGRVRYVFVDVVLDPAHKHAHAAAEAAHCANEQGGYAEFRNRIYVNQKAIDESFLEAHAQAVNLDMPEFRRCMESGRYKTQVEDDTTLVRELRVRGTPSFFWARAEQNRTDVRLVRRLSGIRPIEDFARQFDALNKKNNEATATLIDSLH
jgi:protein-disulfide isomerase